MISIDLTSIFSGGITGGLLVFFLRGWITERLQQSIRHEYAQELETHRHEYSQKLETHKAELNTRIQEIHHENQFKQLRTSLFFDHQRNAFVGMLAKIAETNQIWIDKEYEDEVGLTGPVPYEAFKDLRSIFYEHQLFFDNACLAAINLTLDCYQDSFSFNDGSGRSITRDIRRPYDAIQFLQPRLSELFQSRIGVSTSRRAEREIALLGAIRIINKYKDHFEEIGLSSDSPLKLDRQDEPGEAVAKAEKNSELLLSSLKEFEVYARKDETYLYEIALKISRYLEMLTEPILET